MLLLLLLHNIHYNIYWNPRAVFGLNNRKFGVNWHLRFCPFQKKSEICGVWVRIIHLTEAHTRHISELKFAPTHGTFSSFFGMDKTAGAYSLQICDYLSQIQRETKAFLLIVRHNTKGPPISDWQWRHRMLYFFVGSQNRVNFVSFLKPCTSLCILCYTVMFSSLLMNICIL